MKNFCFLSLPYASEQETHRSPFIRNVFQLSFTSIFTKIIFSLYLVIFHKNFLNLFFPISHIHCINMKWILKHEKSWLCMSVCGSTEKEKGNVDKSMQRVWCTSDKNYHFHQKQITGCLCVCGMFWTKIFSKANVPEIRGLLCFFFTLITY